MRRLFAATLLIAFVLTQTGCGALNKDTQTSGQASGRASGQASENTSIIGDMGAEARQLPADIPGKVSFEIDQGKSAVMEYQANGKSQSVSLQDNQGITWTLKLPEGALLDDTTIKMTVLNNVESEKLGKLEGGVMLEPDGMMFINPAILSVSGNGLDKNGIVLTGSHDGRMLDFAWNTDNKEVLEARLLHFSTAYAGSLTDQLVLQSAKDSWVNYKRYSQGIKEFLKTAIKDPPDPPAISLMCQKNDEGSKTEADQVVKFWSDFMEPEGIYLQKLLSLGSTYERATNGEESIDEKTGFHYEKQLAERWLEKASRLIRKYKTDENKFTAVANVALTAARQYGLLGGDLEQTKYAQLMSQISDWAYTISKKFLSELSNNHDYSYIHPLLRIYRQSLLLSSSLSIVDPLWEKIQNAMKFKVEVETHVDQDGGGDMHIGIDTMATLPFDLLGANAGNITMEGTGRYTNYSDPYKGEEDMSSDLKGADFPVKGFLFNFNPCPVDGSDSFDILLDQFGAETESWTITIIDEEGSQRKEVQSHYVRSIMKKLLEDKKVSEQDALLLSGEFYKFNMTVRNKDKTAAELMLSPADKNCKADLKIKLIHTAPKFNP